MHQPMNHPCLSEIPLLVLVILLLIAVGLITRSVDEEDMGVDQTVVIEKEWQENHKAFVPELPPLAPRLQAKKSDYCKSQTGHLQYL